MSSVTSELRKGRKRRPSNSLEDGDDPVMDDCMAAMVLMSLSCSPKSTFIPDSRGIYSVSVKSIDSGVGGYGSAASRSNTPSPCTINEEPATTCTPIAIEINNNPVETIKENINDSNVNNNQINGLTIIHKDEGIDMDETIDFIIDDPIQTIAEKAKRIVFKCTWRGCGLRCDLVESIEKHIRTVHLGRSENASEEENDHEEEFYYAEIEEEMEIDDNISSKDSCSSSNDSSLGPLSPASSSPESPHITNFNLSPTLSSASLLFFAPSPTWSHLDMARPPHEDPEYQKQQKQMQLQLQLQQQIQLQNQQVQNFNHHTQRSSPMTQTFISAQYKPEPERKTVISSPINIPGISVAHRWSTKMRDSSSSSSCFSANSCNSSYSFSNSHHHHHHHFNQHHHNHSHNHNHNNHHQSQASLLASSSSPVNFFSPKAPSKVMRLSSNTSSPINIKSTGSNMNTSTAVNINGKSGHVTSIISSNNPTMSTNTSTNANNASSNQWTSLLQSSSTSTSLSASSSSSSNSSSPSTTGTATTLLKGSSISPTRRTRTETRKCRKVYGMDNRDSWCTQCKWKKACTRFVD